MQNQQLLTLISDDYFSAGNYVYITTAKFSYPEKWPFTFKIQSIGNSFDPFLVTAKSYTKNLFPYISLNLKDFPITENISIFIEIVCFLLGICFYRSGKKVNIVLDGAHHIYHQIPSLNIKIEKISESSFQISEQELTHFFSEKHKNISQLYKKPYIVPWNLVPREWDVLDMILSEETNKKCVLDLGTGTGKNAFVLADQKIDFWAIEQSEIAIKIAKNCYPDVQNRFLVGLATKLPFKTSCFDYVLDIGCIHCMEPEDYSSAISEIARVLCPGGYLFSRVFFQKDEEWLKKYPVQIDSFGFLEKNVRILLEEYFVLQIEKKGPFIYIKGKRK